MVSEYREIAVSTYSDTILGRGAVGGEARLVA
jgi:hypothetical protein